jgi:predicted ATPase
VQFYERSAVRTLALARHLGHPVGVTLARELRLICAGRVFERRELLVRDLGFITPTPARRIGLYEALRTEATHEAAYRELGYDLILSSLRH